MFRKVFFVLLLIQVSYTLHAQYNETIRSDRPGQGMGPHTVGAWVFQAQAGVDIGGVREDITEFKSNIIASNIVARFGILKNIEINSAWEYRYDAYALSDSVYASNGLSVASIESRINMYKGKNYIPAIGLQFGFRVQPILTEPYKEKQLAPRAMLLISQKLSNKFTLLLNFGGSANGTDFKINGAYVANIGYSINSKWGTFIESYGDFSDDYFANRWDGGFSYLLNNNLQLDLYGGVGYNYNRLDYFTSVGISWRTSVRKNKNEI